MSFNWLLLKWLCFFFPFNAKLQFRKCAKSTESAKNAKKFKKFVSR